MRNEVESQIRPISQTEAAITQMTQQFIKENDFLKLKRGVYDSHRQVWRRLNQQLVNTKCSRSRCTNTVGMIRNENEIC